MYFFYTPTSTPYFLFQFRAASTLKDESKQDFMLS